MCLGTNENIESQRKGQDYRFGHRYDFKIMST